MSSLTGIIFGQSQQVTIAQDGPALVTFDASVIEEHTQTASVTSFPVEEGADTTDHIRLDPVSLTMTGIISDTPIAFFAGLTAAGGTRRARDAYEALLQLQASGELVQVTTTLRSYDNMALTSISVPRDAARGNMVEVALVFQEVRIASAELIAARTPEDPARSQGGDAGTNAPQAASPAQAAAATATPGVQPSSSLLSGLLGIGG